MRHHGSGHGLMAAGRSGVARTSGGEGMNKKGSSNGGVKVCVCVCGLGSKKKGGRF